MKNAPFPETLALVIYVGTFLTREARAAQAGLAGAGAEPAWKRSRCLAPSNARFYGAPLPLYLQDVLQPLPQGAERFIAVK